MRPRARFPGPPVGPGAPLRRATRCGNGGFPRIPDIPQGKPGAKAMSKRLCWKTMFENPVFIILGFRRSFVTAWPPFLYLDRTGSNRSLHRRAQNRERGEFIKPSLLVLVFAGPGRPAQRLKLTCACLEESCQRSGGIFQRDIRSVGAPRFSIFSPAGRRKCGFAGGKNLWPRWKKRK